MINIYFIVEGYTEQKFIEDALIPYLDHRNTLNYNYLNLNGTTKLDTLLKCIKNSMPKYDYVTTFIDLARSDGIKFDNYTTIMHQNIHSQEKSALLEQQLTSKIADIVPQQQQHKFIAHIQPYEFEALCFADYHALCKTDPKIARHITQIEHELKKYNNNPESINNLNFPSARLSKYNYIKKHSTFAVHCNINKIRKNCPHFNNWLLKLEHILKD